MWLDLLLPCFLTSFLGFLLLRWFFISSRPKHRQPISVMLILGSGGHTAEMLKLSQALPDELYSNKVYVIADSDRLSEVKLLQQTPHAHILHLPRSRHVGQSWLTTVWSTFQALLRSLILVYLNRPNLLLCNGPGTCVPVCLAAWLWNILLAFSPCTTKILYVESICRVKSLSLSARLLLPIADQVLVQWPELKQLYPKTVYVARFT